MNLDAVFPQPTYRKGVDADGPDPAIPEVTGHLLRDVYEVLGEIFDPPTPTRVLRLEQDTLAAADPMQFEFVESNGDEISISITRA